MKGKLWTVLAVMVILSLGLAACAPATPVVVEKEVPVTVVKEVPVEVEKEVVVTPTPVPEAPTPVPEPKIVYISGAQS
ncbi:MAG: hypothetical protein GTN71_08600, partial [Anaerolineae bacterium]|nr:hypothetical protein [Gammaproteobacteria bacterium]NIO69080.1 hypothetical protein [Anaerolineae bacterium]